jgi:hypothetical protein
MTLLQWFKSTIHILYNIYFYKLAVFDPASKSNFALRNQVPLKYDKPDQQWKAAFNECNPHPTQHQEPVARSPGGPQTKTGQSTRQSMGSCAMHLRSTKLKEWHLIVYINVIRSHILLSALIVKEITFSYRNNEINLPFPFCSLCYGRLICWQFVFSIVFFSYEWF